MFKDKTVLIIGGTGTLGEEVITQLLKTDVRSIRTLSRNEHKVFLLRQKLNDGRMRFLIGDIRDKDRLNMAMTGVDTVFNFAALKHVSLCDQNPFEAIQTNVLGVQNALECAVRNNVEVFIQMSTDKVVNPTCLYGCTKATAEYLVLNAPQWQGNNRMRCVVVRSGNVLGSSGSVLEVWENQRKAGFPLTVTDLNATRYGAPKEQIAKAVIDIAESDLSGLVVLGMKEYSIKELLATMGDCEVKVTGLRQDEKLREELYREGEKFTLWEIN
jgi:FlaA1/EpsC-like NDP-sugar epimerase